jgi:1,2-diacylglycerol 3-beta-glucosyltransferase
VTDKVSIVQDDPTTNMRKMQPRSTGAQPVERVQLLVLMVSICALTVIVDIYPPSITTFTVLIVYAVIFSIFKLYAREHQSVDRTATRLRESESTQPLVSIVVPAHNEELVLATTIKSILQLDYPSFELIVVDDRSTDQTAAVLRSMQATGDTRFRYITRASEHRPGKAAAINDALKQTSGKLIAVFDADAQVAPDFLARTVPYFANPLVGAVQGRKTLINGNENLITRCQKNEYFMDHHFQRTRDTIRSAVELRGNGMVLRRTALEELGGLNERAVAEDLDLCTRMHIHGWDLRFAEDAVVGEEAPVTVDALFNQRMRWTEGCVLRYLENASVIFTHKKLALRTRLDAFLFIFEFVGPFWLLAENSVLLVRWLSGAWVPQPLLLAAPAMTILCLYFIYASFVGIYKSESGSIVKALKGTVMVYFYLSLLFVPIVFHLMYKFLTNRERDLSWYKTPRYGAAFK